MPHVEMHLDSSASVLCVAACLQLCDRPRVSGGAAGGSGHSSIPEAERACDRHVLHQRRAQLFCHWHEQDVRRHHVRLCDWPVSRRRPHVCCRHQQHCRRVVRISTHVWGSQDCRLRCSSRCIAQYTAAYVKRSVATSVQICSCPCSISINAVACCPLGITATSHLLGSQLSKVTLLQRWQGVFPLACKHAWQRAIRKAAHTGRSDVHVRASRRQACQGTARHNARRHRAHLQSRRLCGAAERQQVSGLQPARLNNWH